MKIEIKKIAVQKNRFRRAFTLVEMLLVVTIIGILAALVIPRIVGVSDRSRVTAANADINGGIKSALGAYEVDNGFFPKSLQDLLVPPPTRKTGTGRIWTSCRPIRGAIPTFIIIPANTARIPTTCFPPGRTQKKARTTTS